MKKRPYRIMIIPALVSIAVVAFLSFYITGVIDRSNALELLDERLEAVCESIDEKNLSFESANEEISSTFCSRARAISVLMAKNTDIFNDENMFEEIRVAVGADVISVTDSKGTIIYSTDMSVEETSALDEFKEAIDNKVFSEAVSDNSENHMKIITGTSRLDSPGIIQIQFSLEKYRKELELSGISDVVSQMPVMKHGHLAVVDSESNTYISHTDNYLNGSPVQFPEKNYSGEKGVFSSDYDGKKVLVKYKRHDDKVIMGILSYSEIYQQRNTAFKWVLFSMILITIVIILSLRNYIIRKKISVS